MADDLMGRYELGRHLPACRAAEVYLATDQDGREVEVTLIEAADPEQTVAAFAAIADARHPRLQRLVEWGRAGWRCVVVAERAEGADLAQVAARGLPEARDVACWGAQAAEALAALHERGLVHGGLCPTALVLDEGGDVTVTQTGVAAAAGAVELADGDPPQNAFYVTPEEVLATPLTPASDVYALAATLYALATGRPPFDGHDALEVARRHVTAAVVPPRQLRPGLPPALDHVLRRGLDKDPRRRPTATALARDLERAALGVRVEAPVAAEGLGDRPPRPWWPWVLGLAFIALLAGILWGAGVLATEMPVPDVRGMTLEEAQATLRAVGLTPGAASYRPPSSAAEVPGTVLEQSPQPGQQATRGDEVDLVLAAEIVVPDVRGMSQARAEGAIRGARLVVGEVQTAPSDTMAAGYVVDQTPAPGSNASAGTTVNLYVSEGSQAGPSPFALGEPWHRAESHSMRALSAASRRGGRLRRRHAKPASRAWSSGSPSL